MNIKTLRPKDVTNVSNYSSIIFIHHIFNKKIIKLMRQFLN